MIPDNVRTLFGMETAKICRAAEALAPSIQDVGVNHGRPNIGVAKEFPHGVDV